MKIPSIILGFFVGLVTMGAAVWFTMPPMMINVYESNHGFEETIAALEESVAEQDGWRVSHVFDIQKNILDAGYGDMKRVKIVTLCNPHYANRILLDDRDKVVATMMPLGIGVYETSDGRVFMSEMNVGLMGRMFGGTIAEVMGEASLDLAAVMGRISAH